MAGHSKREDVQRMIDAESGEAIERYILQHSEEESELLREVARRTKLEITQARMMSSHIQGLFLKFLASAIRPGRMLEIGTLTGYSAIAFASGLPENSILDTIEIDEKSAALAAEFVRRTPYSDRINIIVGDAKRIIPSLRHTYDLVFIDGKKSEYPWYYDAVFDRVSLGGYIVADNALWGGRVIGRADDDDQKTRGVVEFNARVQRDERVENFLLPVRDGFMIIRKRAN